MREVERCARALIEFVAGIAWENATPYARDRATKAAKWHLAALKRARGRTVGYVEISPKTLDAFDRMELADFTGTVSRTYQPGFDHNAKIVLLPKRSAAK